MKTHGLGLLATVVSLTATSWAGAQAIFNWNASAPGNGNFGFDFFWTPAGGPPTVGEEARFNSANSDYFVTFTTDPTNLRCRIGNDHVLFNLNSRTYTLTSNGTAASEQSIMVGGITIVDDALLTLSNGTLAGQNAVIAPGTFPTSFGMVVGSGATLNLAGKFTIGKQKPGTLTIQSGGDVSSTTGVLGEISSGTGAVTGQGSDCQFSTAPIDSQGESKSDGDGGIAGAVAGVCGDTVLSQITSTTITSLNSVACDAAGITALNGYARSFSIAPGPNFVVNCVHFGVEANTGIDFTVTVNIHTGVIPGPVAGLTLQGSQSVTIPAGAAALTFTANFAGEGAAVSIPGGSNLVVEVLTPSRLAADGGDNSGGLYIGSNSSPQTAPSYIRAPACGIPDFTDLTVVGFPDMHVVIYVAGTYVTGTPCPADIAPLPNGNDFVNVDDLLAVINAWGPCANPNDCPADVAPSGGNDFVNVDDLLAVINAWGACP